MTYDILQNVISNIQGTYQNERRNVFPTSDSRNASEFTSN